MKSSFVGALLLVASVLAPSCASSGNSLVLSGGGNPEEDLVDAVRAARAEIQESKEDYALALNLFQRLTTPQAVELDQLSDDFEDAREACDDRAADLTHRMEKVRKESDQLFQGWSTQL